MSSSWFNISGNLSSIASNVTNFTKEVLQDAATDSFEDIHTESKFDQNALNVDDYERPDNLLRKISELQNELQNLNNDNAYKSEQISHLQTESEETLKQYENHFENLKQNLIEKEEEIELLSQSIQDNDITVYQEKIKELHERNLDLEAKLLEENNTSNNNMDTDWTDNWGEDNSGQDINDLAFKNECLVNELTMKEIIINLVESKMFEISNNNVEASNFSEWIDGILHEKTVSEDKFKQISLILDEKMNVENQWKEMCSVIDKHMNEPKGICSENYLRRVDEWLGQQTSKYVELENENIEYRNIISNIEDNIRKFGEGYDNFKITNFTEWLDSVGNGENYIFYNDSSKNILEQIQNEIRDFDDDDGDFQIENFSVWLEKVQCRIDDLEVEVINEQETRDVEEKQRILERETLNDIFNQKQNEISLLKVELYNKTSHTLNPIVEVEQEDLMTVHEQLNETTARCEALQHELATAQKQAMASEDIQQRFNEVSADYDFIKEQLLKAESTNEKIVVELTDLKQKYNILCEENSDTRNTYELLQIAETSSDDLQIKLDELVASNTCMKQEIVTLEFSKESVQTELDEFKAKYDSVCAEFDQLSKEHGELTSRCELLQNAETVSNDLQLQVNNLSAINDCIKEQLVTSESSKESIHVELNDCKIKYNSISTEVEQLTADLKEATNRYELLQAAETVSDSLQLQLNNLSTDKDHLKEQLLISESSKESLLAELNEFKAKSHSICVQFDELSTAYNEMKGENDILQNTLKALQIQLNDESALSDNIKEQLLTSNSTKESIEMELEEYKTKYNCIHEEFDQLSREHNEIINKYESVKLKENTLNEVNCEYEILKELYDGISCEFERVNNKLVESNKSSKKVENELQNIKSEYHVLKLVQLQSEDDIEKLQNDFAALKEINNEISSLNQQMTADIVNVDADLNVMGTLLNKLLNNSFQPCDADVSVTGEKSVILFGSIKDLAEKYVAVQNQCNEFNVVVEEYKTKFLEKESKMGDHEKVCNILVYIIKSINNILPEDTNGNILVKNTLSSTEMSLYVSYLKSLEEFIKNIEETKADYMVSNNELQQEAERMSKLLEMEKVAKEEYISQIDTLNVTMEDYKCTIEQLQSQLNKQTDGEDLEKLLQVERITNEQYITEIDKLNHTIVDYKNTIEQLKAEPSKSASVSGGGGGGDGSGGMKFGAIKRKLQEFESVNQALTKENEELKKSSIGGGEAIPNSSEVADELKRLRTLLSDKKQECECYEEECKHWKSSFLEIQDQIIVANSAHDECQLLKEKLIEYENMLETASNVSDEASVATRHHQEQLHNLSLMLTEKNEEIESYQEETEYLKSKLLEVENETSDLELIREECKQLKTMLVGKEHQNKIDDTITALQAESKQLKQHLSVKDSEMQHMQNMMLEKENELSNMELIREECKQLKQMLVLNGQYPQGTLSSNENAELEAKNAEIIELRNSTSDMDLLREECKQLKQMLLNNSNSSVGVNEPSSKDTTENVSCQLLEAMLEDRDVQIAEKDAVITELQNKTLDMNFIQEECEQLKNMLVEKGKHEAEILDSPSVMQSVNSTTEYFENSFVQQVQQLEGFLKEKEEGLKNRDKEIEMLTGKLLEKENIISDFDLIQNECKILKEMLTEKELVFIELQNDLDNANSVLQQKNIESKVKETSYIELEKIIEESINIISAKDMEILRLNEEVSESVAQDENLHILQTEYRSVEERLKMTENELDEIKQRLEKTEDEFNEVKQTLNETENDCEHLRMYADQHAQLSISLKQKDEELSNLKLQSTENSILESDTVNLLQQQLNELKTLLYGNEQKNKEFIAMLKQKEIELENVNASCDQIKRNNKTLDEHLGKSKLEIENLQTEKTTLLQLCGDKESNVKLLEDRVSNLQMELEKNINIAAAMNKQNIICEETINKNTLVVNDKDIQINSLIGQLEQSEVEKRNLEIIVNNNEINMKGQEDKVSKIQTIVDDSVKEINEKTSKISQLESELTRSNEYQEQLVESIKLYSCKDEQSTVCKNCEYLNNERKRMHTILENIETMLQISGQQQKLQDRTYPIIEHLSMVEACVQNLLKTIDEKEIEISDLNCSKNEMKLNHEKYMNEELSIISTLEKKLEESTTLIITQKNTYDLKIQHLQSQLVENSEIQTLYQTKCLEYNDLKEHFLKVQNENKEQKINSEIAANSKMSEELEHLRKELERNCHLYLNKNKECDSLKLEMLQLEETVYELKLNIETMKGFEETAKLTPALQLTINNKDEEIDRLKSILEDNELKLESSKKEKQFLDDLLKAKEHSEKEKGELLFQNEQSDRLIQEKEVLLRHKDITLRELESKTKRELERLRNHMLMSEETHTKDIIELQERAESLQQELEDAKQGLSKKSIILQDSNKQFQEHCIDLEEQLRSISVQRDSAVLELSRCHDKIAADAAAIYNLQNALEQLQKEKVEQSEYLSSFAKRKEIEYESRIEELSDDLNKSQGAISEAALAVQGINKLNLELQQKENELKVSKEKINELATLLHQMELERDKILEAADHKLDKSLLRNLLMKYFQSPNDKRSDILHVIGGLLGWSSDEIQQIGSGAAPSKVGGWITSVWSYGSPRKTSSSAHPRSAATTPTFDSNKSFSELFVKFLENETTSTVPIDTTSLTLNNEVAPNIQMFVSPTTPDILAFHSGPDQRIPAPGQEIPRVHTHHAQSTLKSILTSSPY